MRLQDAKWYGLEEYKTAMEEAAWRSLRLAFFKKQIADAYLKIGRSEDALIAYTAYLASDR